MPFQIFQEAVQEANLPDTCISFGSVTGMP